MVNISDRQSASHAPFVPIASGNRIKHGIRKTNPRNRANKLASFYIFHALVITDEHQVDDEENKCQGEIWKSLNGYERRSAVRIDEQAYQNMREQNECCRRDYAANNGGK